MSPTHSSGTSLTHTWFLLLHMITRFSERVHELSSHNLQKLALEAETKRKFCQHRGLCRNNAFRGFSRAFTSALVVKYLVAVAQSLLTGQLRKRLVEI